MTALIRLKSCALDAVGWLLLLLLAEPRPAHSGESVEYQGPERNEGGAWWL